MSQGSILGPHLFIILINDIVNDIDYNKRLFARDTIIENAPYAAICLNLDQDSIVGHFASYFQPI